MKLTEWLEERESLNTLAGQVRLAYENGVKYVVVTRAVRNMYFAEAMLEHDGNQSKAARKLNVHRNTINRLAWPNFTAILRRHKSKP